MQGFFFKKLADKVSDITGGDALSLETYKLESIDVIFFGAKLKNVR